MSKKSTVLKQENPEEMPNTKPSSVKIERAAERISSELDKVIHERMRLGIISALAANKSLSFTELKNLLNTTDGNISVHARKLEDAGYLIVVFSNRLNFRHTNWKLYQVMFFVKNFMI